MNEEIFKNGIVGKFNGYRLGGKSYDANGKEIQEEHKEDFFCCRNKLLSNKQE